MSKLLDRIRRSMIRQSDFARRREQMLRVAAEQVGSIGTKGLSPAGIAAECGIAKSTVYHHLGTHQDMLDQLTVLLIRDFAEHFDMYLRRSRISSPTLMKAYARTVDTFIQPGWLVGRGAALLRLRLEHPAAERCWNAWLELTTGSFRTTERLRDWERTRLRVDALWLYAVLHPDRGRLWFRDQEAEAQDAPLMQKLLWGTPLAAGSPGRLNLMLDPRRQLARIFDPHRELEWYGPYRTVPLSRYDAYY